MPATTTSEKFVPKFPGQLVDPSGDAVTYGAVRVSKLNRRLGKSIASYYPSLGEAWEAITKVLADAGIFMIQEDGARWAGLLLGTDSQASFPLVWEQSDVATVLAGGITGEGFVLLKQALQLSWHRMQSGRYEIVVYVS